MLSRNIRKICTYCGKGLHSEKDVLDHARRHARRFWNPRFCSFEEAVKWAFAAIWLHSKDP